MEELGRIVPTKELSKNHIGSYTIVKELLSRGDIEIDFIDNSLGKHNARVMNRIKFDSIKYPSVEELTAQFNKRAKELLDKGVISPEQYAEYIR